MVEVTAGHTSNMGELALQSAGQIAGLVSVQGSGNPIAGALVTISEVLPAALTSCAPTPVFQTTTDSAGSYLVYSVPAATIS